MFIRLLEELGKLLCFVFCLACFAFCIASFLDQIFGTHILDMLHRFRRSGPIEDDATVARRLNIAGAAIICQDQSSKQIIAVDTKAMTMVFENCSFSNSSSNRDQKHALIKFQVRELRNFRQVVFRNRMCHFMRLFIETPVGLTSITESATNFRQLVEFMSANVTSRPMAPHIDSPRAFAYARVAGAIVGVAAGIGFAGFIWGNRADQWLPLAMLIGGVAGFLIVQLIIFGVYNRFRFNLARPLGGGVLGLVLVLLLVSSLHLDEVLKSSGISNSAWPLPVFGFGLGFMLGFIFRNAPDR